MALRLLTVEPRQGWVWLTQGVAHWWQRPLAFVGLFMCFLLAVTLLMLIPLFGQPLGLTLVPMLSLGFMVATRSAMAGGWVHPLHLIEGLRHPNPRQRRAQWLLGIGFSLGTLLIWTLADKADHGLFEELQRSMGQTDAQGQASARVVAILRDPLLAWGMVVRLGLISMMSVPFWHAPALVHWGRQGALQALFSSTVAIWRTKAAFSVYLAGWAGLFAAALLAMILLTLLTGLQQLMALLTMPVFAGLSAAFYVSLWFSFADTFDAHGLPQKPSPSD
jgi:hypothetical protein